MATFDYSRPKATADRLIKRFGKPAFIRVPGALDLTDKWNPVSGPDVDHPVTVIELEYNQQDVDGTLVQQRDKMFLLAVEKLSFEVSEDHRLVVGTHDYEIVTCKPLNPGGTIIMYTIQAR